MTQRPSLDAALAQVGNSSGKRFWRSLDELVDRPDFAERLKRDFPALAGIAGDWRRRDILKCLGGALALAGLDGCERAPDEDALPYVVQPEGEVPGIARYYATAVELDGVAQPVIGKTRMARPIKLEGNPRHPASGGATDAFTQAALLGLYDPERSKAPRFEGHETDWAHFDTAMVSLRAQLDASGGEGFALLTGPVGSPTLLRQIDSLRTRWPKARWHSWSPLPARASPLRLADVEVVVALDDDLIGPGPYQTFHAKGWAERRRGYQAGKGKALLFVAEPSPTITGVTATDRLSARQERIPILAAALSGVPQQLNSREAAWVTEASAALAAAGGRGLVTLGAHHDGELHESVRAFNLRRANAAAAAPSAPMGDAHALEKLIADLRSGEARTLFVLDANPAYASPLAATFRQLLRTVPLSIHAALHADETAAECKWHVPLAHLLESWSDGRAADGSAVPIQPLVRPWLDVRGRHAVMSGLLGDAAVDVDIVKATWQLDDKGWEAALLTGSIEASPPVGRSPAPTPPRSAIGAPALQSDAAGLSLILRPDPCVWDGRLAPNPWLQELPKPLTKITWGNAIHVSPALARERGLENEDLVRLRIGERAVTGPVWVLPGQERATVLVHVGHGRTHAGRVADGVGFDAWPLVGAMGEVRLEKLGGKEQIASTQHHFAMQDDEFVRFVDKAGDALPKKPPQPNFFPPQKSSPAWGMAIDLDLCIGCNACVVACIAENNVPMVGKDQVAQGREMHWIRVDRYYQGSPDDPQHAFQPVPCMHCEDAPCEMGCPVNAAVHSPDGLNLQVYNRCIGTRTCSAYCPYKVRRFNWFDLTSDAAPEIKAQRNPEVTVRSRGVMEKCTYCIQRISAARIEAKKADRPIAEGEVVTACQAACPTQAIVFGDVSRKDSAVSQRKADRRDYDLLEEANTRPRTTYQARIRKGDRA